MTVRRALLAALAGLPLLLLKGDQVRSDDVAPLLGPGPNDASAIRGGQGVVVEWDSLTAENVIRFRGTDLVNLPILATSTEVMLIKPGDSVFLHILGTGAAATIYVVGRITQPGTPQAGSFFELFGFQTATETTEGRALSLFSSMGDLQSPATPGPSVTVNVGQTRRVLVLVHAEIVSIRGSQGFGGGNVGIQVSGANTAAASDQIGVMWDKWQENTGAAFESWACTGSHFYTGLNSGSTTFTMKYGKGSSDADLTTTMKNRSIMALPY